MVDSSSYKHQNQFEKFMEARRIERENIGVMGVAALWGKSPARERFDILAK